MVGTRSRLRRICSDRFPSHESEYEILPLSFHAWHDYSHQRHQLKEKVFCSGAELVECVIYTGKGITFWGKGKNNMVHGVTTIATIPRPGSKGTHGCRNALCRASRSSDHSALHPVTTDSRATTKEPSSRHLRPFSGGKLGEGACSFNCLPSSRGH